jgi:hypothetical protein
MPRHKYIIEHYVPLCMRQVASHVKEGCAMLFDTVLCRPMSSDFGASRELATGELSRQ